MNNIEVAKIINAFSQYVKTGEQSLVRNFTPEQVRTARDRKVHPENDRLLWQIMTGWIEQREQSRKQKRETREKWIFAIVAFVLGILSQWLAKLFF